jgi:hypothetical protein
MTYIERTEDGDTKLRIPVVATTVTIIAILAAIKSFMIGHYVGVFICAVLIMYAHQLFLYGKAIISLKEDNDMVVDLLKEVAESMAAEEKKKAEAFGGFVKLMEQAVKDGKAEIKMEVEEDGQEDKPEKDREEDISKAD